MLRASLGSLKLRYPVLTRSRQLSLGSRSVRHGGVTRRAVARTTLFTLTLGSAFLVSSIYADSIADDENKKEDSTKSLGSLVRAYTVYSLCSIPALVDASPKILSVLSSVPGLKQITEAFVRVTFFNQFVGADSAEEALPLIHSLRAANRGVLFAYSIEVDENEATGGSASFSLPSTDNSVDSSTSTLPSVSPHVDDAQSKRIVDEMLHCIDVAADFEAGLSNGADGVASGQGHVPVDAAAVGRGRRTWVAVKMTALLPDAHALIAWSSHIIASRKGSPSPEGRIPFPGAPRIDDMAAILDSKAAASPLTPDQIRHIRELYADLYRICMRAKERGVKVIVDAEYSWYQPAIDSLTLALMREFNSLDQSSSTGAQVQPLVYGTFQAYLRRTPAHLALALEDARKNNYALGVKLVRGAYHPHELAAHEAALAFDRAHGQIHTAVTAPRPSLSISPDILPPVWLEKKETDEAYNHCVGMLIKTVKEDVGRRDDVKGGSVMSTWKKCWHSGWLGAAKNTKIDTAVEPRAPGIGILFGTHNWGSCALIMKELVRNGLAVEDHRVSGSVGLGGNEQVPIQLQNEVVERVAIGQLYGMSDDLTEWVVSRIISNTPFVIKYVPYGALADVMPYLSRRAIENKSMLGDGNAEHERQRARQEIWKKIFG
ncbi:hypothetical protein GALMADRAFT_256542 [Galerina marginata CBS 339.88]|uniref:Proline dehydrogenase n=1 Tax=Galerina marginata (strain CBS 339.88) TaxID=685588 RepID=A0A067SLX4_GALM3|nr:hypothetical protein GALMADRAFT_256542 [Galerina marginata CBS 339.88]